MKTKKIVTLVLITFLLSFSQKGFAQDWTLWFSKNGVDFLTMFVPKKGNNDAYFHLKVVNKSGVYKTIYFYPV